MNPQEKEYLEKLKTIEELKIGVLQHISIAADNGLKTDEIFGALESAKHLAQKFLNTEPVNVIEKTEIVGYR